MAKAKTTEMQKALDALEFAAAILGDPERDEFRLQDAHVAATIGVGHAILAVAQEVRG